MDKEDAKNLLNIITAHMVMFRQAMDSSFPKNIIVFYKLAKLEKELAKQGIHMGTYYPYGLNKLVQYYINRKEN